MCKIDEKFRFDWRYSIKIARSRHPRSRLAPKEFASRKRYATAMKIPRSSPRSDIRDSRRRRLERRMAGRGLRNIQQHTRHSRGDRCVYEKEERRIVATHDVNRRGGTDGRKNPPPPSRSSRLTMYVGVSER